MICIPFHWVNEKFRHEFLVSCVGTLTRLNVRNIYAYVCVCVYVLPSMTYIRNCLKELPYTSTKTKARKRNFPHLCRNLTMTKCKIYNTIYIPFDLAIHFCTWKNILSPHCDRTSGWRTTACVIRRPHWLAHYLYLVVDSAVLWWRNKLRISWLVLRTICCTRTEADRPPRSPARCSAPAHCSHCWSFHSRLEDQVSRRLFD
jgi:hypothetical protein